PLVNEKVKKTRVCLENRASASCQAIVSMNGSSLYAKFPTRPARLFPPQTKPSGKLSTKTVNKPVDKHTDHF
ncbi:hypothetical protein ABTD78_22880, partial [Acinetobacter baumannii]